MINTKSIYHSEDARAAYRHALKFKKLEMAVFFQSEIGYQQAWDLIFRTCVEETFYPESATLVSVMHIHKLWSKIENKEEENANRLLSVATKIVCNAQKSRLVMDAMNASCHRDLGSLNEIIDDFSNLLADHDDAIHKLAKFIRTSSVKEGEGEEEQINAVILSSALVEKETSYNSLVFLFDLLLIKTQEAWKAQGENEASQELLEKAKSWERRLMSVCVLMVSTHSIEKREIFGKSEVDEKRKFVDEIKQRIGDIARLNGELSANFFDQFKENENWENAVCNPVFCSIMVAVGYSGMIQNPSLTLYLLHTLKLALIQPDHMNLTFVNAIIFLVRQSKVDWKTKPQSEKELENEQLISLVEKYYPKEFNNETIKKRRTEFPITLSMMDFESPRLNNQSTLKSLNSTPNDLKKLESIGTTEKNKTHGDEFAFKVPTKQSEKPKKKSKGETPELKINAFDTYLKLYEYNGNLNKEDPKFNNFYKNDSHEVLKQLSEKKLSMSKNLLLSNIMETSRPIWITNCNDLFDASPLYKKYEGTNSASQKKNMKQKLEKLQEEAEEENDDDEETLVTKKPANVATPEKKKKKVAAKKVTKEEEEEEEDDEEEIVKKPTKKNVATPEKKKKKVVAKKVAKEEDDDEEMEEDAPKKQKKAKATKSTATASVSGKSKKRPSKEITSSDNEDEMEVEEKKKSDKQPAKKQKTQATKKSNDEETKSPKPKPVAQKDVNSEAQKETIDSKLKKIDAQFVSDDEWKTLCNLPLFQRPTGSTGKRVIRNDESHIYEGLFEVKSKEEYELLLNTLRRYKILCKALPYFNEPKVLANESSKEVLLKFENLSNLNRVFGEPEVQDIKSGRTQIKNVALETPHSRGYIPLHILPTTRRFVDISENAFKILILSSLMGVGNLQFASLFVKDTLEKSEQSNVYIFSLDNNRKEEESNCAAFFDLIFSAFKKPKSNDCEITYNQAVQLKPVLLKFIDSLKTMKIFEQEEFCKRVGIEQFDKKMDGKLNRILQSVLELDNKGREANLASAKKKKKTKTSTPSSSKNSSDNEDEMEVEEEEEEEEEEKPKKKSKTSDAKKSKK